MLLRAAEKARQQRRFRQALTFIRQAVDIWPLNVEPETRLGSLQEMARCAINCREATIARRAWEEILETASDAARLVEAHRQLAELDLGEGCFDDAGRHLETAAELAGKSLAASEAANCWLAYADPLANCLLVGKAREAIASACHFAEKSGDPAVISEAIGYAGLVAAMCGRAPEASDLVERALRIALDQELPEQTALAYRRRANVCEYRADYTGEAAAHLEAIHYCRTARERAGELSCLSCLAGAYSGLANGGTLRRPQMPSCATGESIPPIRQSRAQYVLNWPFFGANNGARRGFSIEVWSNLDNSAASPESTFKCFGLRPFTLKTRANSN